MGFVVAASASLVGRRLPLTGAGDTTMNEYKTPEAEIVDVVEAAPVPIRVGGRGKLSCVAIMPWRGMVELKLEDACTPDFWAHVHLDVATLEALLALAKAR
jgi:hypothetical protein